MSANSNYVEELLRSSGIEESADVTAQLLAYLDGILEINKRINLTRIVDRESAVMLHVYDSLTCLPEMREAPFGPICDVGTGGGFPGVPLAVVTLREAILVDSVAKKCAAVTEVLDSMNLGADVRCLATRAESLAEGSRGRFAAVVARAVAPLPSLVELASPLLEVGGYLIAMKGDPGADEKASGRAVAAIVGMEVASERVFTLPSGGDRRTIISYCKTGEAGIPLPRRNGLAQHQPLA